MFDDAEKKIASLMRESTTSGESKPGLGKIKVRGFGNFVALGDVTVTINLHSINTAEGTPRRLPSPGPAPADDEIKKSIVERCVDLGDGQLFRPFIEAVFKKTEIEALAATELHRLQAWLGINETHKH